MKDEEFIYYLSQAMTLVLYLSLPVVIIATIVGLGAGLFQALTSIQDQTLPFGLKLIGVIVVLLFTAQWMGNELLIYTDRVYQAIALVRP